jgi:hypothetical protein
VAFEGALAVDNRGVGLGGGNPGGELGAVEIDRRSRKRRKPAGYADFLLRRAALGDEQLGLLDEAVANDPLLSNETVSSVLIEGAGAAQTADMFDVGKRVRNLGGVLERQRNGLLNEDFGRRPRW